MRTALNLRIPDELKTRIEQYAQRHGITRNAAITVLITKGLDAEGAATR